jgi:hypothetical protein
VSKNKAKAKIAAVKAKGKVTEPEPVPVVKPDPYTFTEQASNLLGERLPHSDGIARAAGIINTPKRTKKMLRLATSIEMPQAINFPNIVELA